MRRSGEDIIITTTGEMQRARELASRASHTRLHSWSNLWYINSQTKRLTRDTYCEGKYYTTLIGMGEDNRAKLDGGINFWFCCWPNRGLTILDAMVRYGRGWVQANAKRLGGTGEYSKY